MVLGDGAKEDDPGAEPDEEELDEPPPLTGDPDVAPGTPSEEESEGAPPLTGDSDVAPGTPLVGAVAEPAGCEEELTGCASDAELAGFGAPAVPLDEVGGRRPLETDDKDEVPVELEWVLVGEGGRIGCGTKEDDSPAGSEVAVMKVVDEEVTVMGQTVVETGTTIVLTGQSLMPGPQL